MPILCEVSNLVRGYSIDIREVFSGSRNQVSQLHDTVYSVAVYTFIRYLKYFEAWSPGQVEDTEVQKPKYRNRSTEVWRKAIYRCLVRTTVPCSQRVAVSKWRESQALTHRTPASTNTVV